MFWAALQFSGGKDSLACLYLYKERWQDIAVVWVNTGAAYPETVRWMREHWAKVLPHFIEVNSNQPKFIEEHGIPSDIVPVNSGIQSYMDCCSANLWEPMQNAMNMLGVKRIIRGQRADEKRKSTIKSGHIENGIEYIFPVEDWSKEQVFKYLKDVKAPLPEYYETEETSRDCWSCTAYMDENKARIQALPIEQKAIVIHRLNMIKSAVNESMKHIEELT